METEDPIPTAAFNSVSVVCTVTAVPFPFVKVAPGVNRTDCSRSPKASPVVPPDVLV